LSDFNLPKSWDKQKISEICEINPSKKEIQNLSDNTEVSFVPMANLDEQRGEILLSQTKPLGQVKNGFRYFKENDVLFAKITPCMENGKSAIARNLKNGIGFGSTEFYVLRPNKTIIPEWLFFFLRQKLFRKMAEETMHGTAGQQRVPKDFLKNTQIPIPPKPLSFNV